MKFAVALLLANCSAIKVQQKVASTLPRIPVSGAEIVAAVAGVAQEGKGELSRAMHSQDCWSPGGDQPDECWDRGLRRDLSRFNRDAIHGMKELGIDFSSNTYDPKFITDLIEAEYAAFADDLVANQAAYGADLDKALQGASTTLTGLGLAQLKSTLPNCDQVRDDFWNSPAAQNGWNEEMEASYRQTMSDCYMNSPLAQQVAGELSVATMQTQVQNLVRDAAAAAGNAKQVQELDHVISDVNSKLKRMATVLNVTPVPTLPNPKDTAAKIAQAVKKAAPMLDGADAQRELTEGLTDMRRDAIEAAYEFDNEMQHAPSADDVSRELAGAGFTVTAPEVTAFEAGVKADVAKLATPAMQQKLMGLAKH